MATDMPGTMSTATDPRRRKVGLASQLPEEWVEAVRHAEVGAEGIDPDLEQSG